MSGALRRQQGMGNCSFGYLVFGFSFTVALQGRRCCQQLGPDFCTVSEVFRRGMEVFEEREPARMEASMFLSGA
jgi:hypothetical protein